MPTATYIALANYTVPSGGLATVTFSSIPATYRDLVLVFNGTASTSVQGLLHFNGDTTAGNYSAVRMFGEASGPDSSTLQDRPYNFYTVETMVRINIMDYSATDKHKTALSRWDSSTAASGATAYRWANTNAITSIIVDPNTADFNAGVTLALYGIVS